MFSIRTIYYFFILTSIFLNNCIHAMDVNERAIFSYGVSSFECPFSLRQFNPEDPHRWKLLAIETAPLLVASTAFSPVRSLLWKHKKATFLTTLFTSALIAFIHSGYSWMTREEFLVIKNNIFQVFQAWGLFVQSTLSELHTVETKLNTTSVHAQQAFQRAEQSFVDVDQKVHKKLKDLGLATAFKLSMAEKSIIEQLQSQENLFQERNRAAESALSSVQRETKTIDAIQQKLYLLSPTHISGIIAHQTMLITQKVARQYQEHFDQEYEKVEKSLTKLTETQEDSLEKLSAIHDQVQGNNQKLDVLENRASEALQRATQLIKNTKK